MRTNHRLAWQFIDVGPQRTLTTFQFDSDDIAVKRGDAAGQIPRLRDADQVIHIFPTDAGEHDFRTGFSAEELFHPLFRNHLNLILYRLSQRRHGAEGPKSSPEGPTF